MKKIFILFIVLSGSIFQSCDETNGGDEWDITTPIPPYVELSAKTALAAKEGTPVNVPVRLRTGVQQDVTFQYEVSGAVITSGTATIPRNTLQVNVPITIPTGTIPAGAASTTATFTLVSATMGTQALTVGHRGAELEKRTLTITK